MDEQLTVVAGVAERAEDFVDAVGLTGLRLV